MLLSKEVKGLNVFYLDGKEINRIYLYNDKECLDFGLWFRPQGNNISNEINTILDLGKVYRQNKVDLSKKRSFYVRFEGNLWREEKKIYDLYIYTGDNTITYNNVQEIVYNEDDKEIGYIKTADILYNGNILMENAIINNTYRIVKKEKGIAIDKFINQLKNDGIEISDVKAEKIFNLYELIKKIRI